MDGLAHRTLATMLVAARLAARGRRAGGRGNVSQARLTTETSNEQKFGPLLSEIPATCAPEEHCHWTLTQGADERNGNKSTATDEEGDPYLDPYFGSALVPNNYWHIQRNAQHLTLLPFIGKHLIKLRDGRECRPPSRTG